MKAFVTSEIEIECPKLRALTTMPDVVNTGAMFRPFAIGHEEMTVELALYFAEPRADCIRGSVVGINWNIEEMGAHQERTSTKELLKMSWLPVLPLGGAGVNSRTDNCSQQALIDRIQAIHILL